MFSFFEENEAFSVDDTHPVSQERIKFIFDQIKRDFDEETSTAILNFSSIVEEVFESIVSIIDDKPENHLHLETDIKRKIDDLFNKYCQYCSMGRYIVPDYSGFQSEMHELIYNGHFRAIYEAFCDVADRANKTMRGITSQKISMDSMTDEDIKTHVLAYNKIKLIIGFTEQLTEPLSIVFRDVLQPLSK